MSAVALKLDYPALSFGWEPLDWLIREGIGDLTYEHWSLTARDREAVPYDPDWDFYRREDGRRSRWFICRVHGEIAGYVIVFLLCPPHNRTTFQALEDTFWLSPKFRKGWVGINFLKAYETALAELGVVKAYLHERPELTGDRSATVGKLFERLGWRRGDVTYSKLIGP